MEGETRAKDHSTAETPDLAREDIVTVGEGVACIEHPRVEQGTNNQLQFSFTPRASTCQPEIVAKAVMAFLTCLEVWR